MKPITQSLAIVLVISSALLVAHCGNPAKANHSPEIEHPDAHDKTTEHKGTCPMHPEVTGAIGAPCPKCGMKLELVSDEKAANKNDYVMHFKATPQVRPGAASMLSFTPLITGRETERVPLDIQHDKKIHLIIVSKDLSYFDHVHPELQEDGTYDIRVLADGSPYTNGKFHNETKFTQGGDYVLFADYLPSGANHQVERIELNVAGTSSPAKKYTSEKLVSETDGYEVSLATEGGTFFNEGTTHIAGIIRRNGVEMPADQFENFLAAKAHVVMISEDSKNYLHVHPEVVKGRLSLHTTFDVPGIFRGWMQFKTNGQVHTADFVIKVEKGKALQHGGQKHKH